MPVTKDTNIEEKEKKVRTRKTTAKKTTSKVETEEKPKAKKVSATITKTTKKAVTKKATASKTTATKKKATTKKTTTAKKTTTKKTTRTTRKKKLVEEIEEINEPKVEVIEYYDLPYRYNQTIVRMLAQSPHTLFVYWDISDEDREKMKKQYGDDFFNVTKPVLIITNKTKNYTFEIEINDFANCWYFNVDDEKCDYSVELGRRIVNINNTNIEFPNNYLFISSSNEIESPNGHILFEKEQSTIYFRNVKENYEYSKDVANLHFINRLKRIYKIYDLYKIMYKNEEFNDAENPTSNFI